MSYWEGLVLGVVQGLTEFLPISSSGHLVLAQAALGLTPPGVVVEVTLHVATLLAVLVVYRTRLIALMGGARRGDRASWRFIGLLAVGTVPAGMLGVLFADFFERTFESLLVVGVSLLITGCLLWSTRWVAHVARASEPTWLGAFGIGVAQALALFPGISRSGSTVVTAMWLRIDPVRAAEFSFLLAVPAIAGAAVLQIPDLGVGIASVGKGPLTLSFLASLVSGVAAIQLLISLLRSRAFHVFAFCLWTLGMVTRRGALVRGRR
jgi:undecaprenyl-diphosphatase